VPTLARAYAAAGWRTAGFVNQPHLVKENGFGQGFDVYQTGEFDADKIASLFADWHSALKPSDRAFVYLHFLDCHAPYWEHQPFAGMFGPTSRAWASCPDWRTPGVWSAFRDEVNAGKRAMPAEEGAELLNLFDGAVRYTDHAIGGVIDRLSACRALDEALVAVFGDHGEDFLEHGVLGHDPPFFFEEQIRIPIIVKFPASWGIGPARMPYEAQTIDLTATLAAAAGKGRFGHGRNLLDEAAMRESVPIVTESAEGMTVLKDGLKGYIWTKGVVPQVAKVYDVRSDPAERMNVAAHTPVFTSTVEEYLVSWRESTARVYASLDSGRASVTMSKENAAALKALGYLH
jgi:arylsulfatase A-like enzyme